MYATGTAFIRTAFCAVSSASSEPSGPAVHAPVELIPASAGRRRILFLDQGSRIGIWLIYHNFLIFQADALHLFQLFPVLNSKNFSETFIFI
ncbi:MAG: hypothetical protein MR727_03900 [Lentisphaeria bacterium]|nr:hypothetical protein [Lentisphaeria bacterium]